MDAASFRRRAETFGFDTSDPWALEALQLLFRVPRAYETLVDAWDARHPGVRAALDRLTADEWISYQPAIIVDLRTGKPAQRTSRPVARYVLTAAGRRLLEAANDDLRVLEARWSQLASHNAPSLRTFISAFDLDNSHARYGMSTTHAAHSSGLADRTARWWVRKLHDDKLLRLLDDRAPDVREVVPAHWRIARPVCRQLSVVLEAFGAQWAALRAQWPLSKTRFLSDIDPARIGVSGATDYDHDIEAQRLCSIMLRSARASEDRFDVEPKYTLRADTTVTPHIFNPSADGVVFYQPDAVLFAADDAGRMRRVVVEYERYQSRRDAWAHIERFCGWVGERLLPFESAMLCFVVDSEPRLRGYVELIEAFADFALEHPQLSVPNPLTLAVSSTRRITAVSDPLDDRAWFRVPLPAGTGERLVLHDPDDSPYDAYFSRKAEP